MSFRLRPLFLLIALGFTAASCIATPPPDTPEAVTARLATMLGDPHADLRRTAALSLGKIAVPASADALIRALGDPDHLVRQYSAWALGNLEERAPDTAGPALVALFADTSPAVAAAAAEAIGRIGASPRTVDLITQALRDPSVQTRRAAVKALAWLEARSTYSALVRALQDPDAEVRQGALAALGEMGDSQAASVMRDRLQHDRSAGVRTEAAYRLGKLGDSGAVPALQTTAKTDPDNQVRRWAAWAIGQLESSGEPGSTT